MTRQPVPTTLPLNYTATIQQGIMPLPPQAQYTSREALFEAIQAWAKPLGYAFTTGKSKRLEGSKRWKVYYTCDRSYQPPIRSRVRHTSSRGTGCQFSVVAIETQDKLTWELKHRPEYKFSIHNHAPSPHPGAHPSHRHMPPQTQALTQVLFTAGIYKFI